MTGTIPPVVVNDFVDVAADGVVFEVNFKVTGTSPPFVVAEVVVVVVAAAVEVEVEVEVEVVFVKAFGTTLLFVVAEVVLVGLK